MSKQDEFRRYAAECMESAKTSTSDDVRKQFLNLAQTWLTAAQQLDDGISIPGASKRDDESGKTQH